jgi:hypothetical protein
MVVVMVVVVVVVVVVEEFTARVGLQVFIYELPLHIALSLCRHESNY